MNNEFDLLKTLVRRGIKAVGAPSVGNITPETVGALLLAGLEAEDKLVRELIENHTYRAQKFNEALTAQIYVEAMGNGLARSLQSRWEREAEAVGLAHARSEFRA